MSNLKRAQEFCDVWATLDLDKIMGFLTPDCFYHNIPMEPLVGHAAIRPFMEPMVAGSSSIKYVVHAIAEAPNGWVLTERTDVMVMGDKTVSIPVMGVFEFKDGLISSWRDYWDLADFQRQMA
jgi:limonene-1,2-epoxide hydrolase